MAQSQPRPRPHPSLPRKRGRVREGVAGKRFLALACSALLIMIAAAISPARAQQFDAESFTLANGLQVVVLPNHRVPAVTQMVWYKIGAADDPRGKSGSAH